MPTATETSTPGSATGTTPTQTSEPTNPGAPTWAAKILKQWAGLQLGKQAINEAKLMRQARSVERLVKKNQDGTLGKETTEPQDGDDMIRIGDETHYHSQPAAAKAPSAPSTLAKVAAPLLLGATLGAGGLVAAHFLFPDEAAPATQPQEPHVDEVGRFRLEFAD